jgi:hypothetical protein
MAGDAAADEVRAGVLIVPVPKCRRRLPAIRAPTAVLQSG